MPDSKEIVAKYDLSPKLTKFFDLHLNMFMLEYVDMCGIYDKESMVKYKLELLEQTDMLDAYDEYYQQFYSKPSHNIEEKRQKLQIEWENRQQQVKSTAKILETGEVADMITKVLKHEDLLKLHSELREKYHLNEENFDILFNVAKFFYEVGSYENTSTYLHTFINISLPNNRHYLDALWGVLASNILQRDFDTAHEDLMRVKSHIDNHVQSSELRLLQQRAWLLHWSLFTSFRPEEPDSNDLALPEDIIEITFSNVAYQNALQVICPHLLRYLTVAVILSPKCKTLIKDLVKIIQLEEHQYSDPITELILQMSCKYDFDAAQAKLSECELVLESDLFLNKHKNAFIDQARRLVFETFCRIHQKISIDMLASKLNMKEKQEAEKWIVDLIRKAGLDAKIDTANGHVIMGARTNSLHEQVMENTKRLSLRTQQMYITLEKVQKDKLGSSAYMAY